MRISDWSSDVCSSDLSTPVDGPTVEASRAAYEIAGLGPSDVDVIQIQDTDAGAEIIHMAENGFCADGEQEELVQARSEEHTSELQSLMRISYAVFCLKKKTYTETTS